MVTIWSLVPLPFLSPAWTSVSSWFMYYWIWLGKIEHYFASVWDECSCTAVWTFLGFPGGSDVKESACSTQDLGLIPVLGRSLGEGNGNPLQYSWQENPTDRGAWWATVHGSQRVRHDWVTSLTYLLIDIKHIDLHGKNSRRIYIKMLIKVIPECLGSFFNLCLFYLLFYNNYI